MIEQRNLLGDAHRVVPWQHHHHGPEPGTRGFRRHVGEELEHIGTHGVVGEMVLHRPDGVEPQGLGHLGQPQLLAIDLGVGETVAGVLKQRSKADVHEILLVRLMPEILHMIKAVLHTETCRRVVLSLEHCRGRVKHSLIGYLKGPVPPPVCVPRWVTDSKLRHKVSNPNGMKLSSNTLLYQSPTCFLARFREKRIRLGSMCNGMGLDAVRAGGLTTHGGKGSPGPMDEREADDL